ENNQLQPILYRGTKSVIFFKLRGPRSRAICFDFRRCGGLISNHLEVSSPTHLQVHHLSSHLERFVRAMPKSVIPLSELPKIKSRPALCQSQTPCVYHPGAHRSSKIPVPSVLNTGHGRRSQLRR